MTLKETMFKILNSILEYCLAHPFVAIIGLFAFLFISLLISHWLDSMEGSFRHKVLWIIFVLILAAIIVIILLALKSGSLSLNSLSKIVGGG